MLKLQRLNGNLEVGVVAQAEFFDFFGLSCREVLDFAGVTAEVEEFGLGRGTFLFLRLLAAWLSFAGFEIDARCHAVVAVEDEFPVAHANSSVVGGDGI